MKTKKEIKNKLEDAEAIFDTEVEPEKNRLAIVIITLRWVLNLQIQQEPIDPLEKDD